MKNNRAAGAAALFVGMALLGQNAFGQTIPRPAAPWWTARTLDRQNLTIQQFKGKNVVLAFLLTT